MIKSGAFVYFILIFKLKVYKNQASNLGVVENRFILDFGADFSCILLVFSIITPCGAGRETRPLQNLSGKISFLQRADIESALRILAFTKTNGTKIITHCALRITH